MSGFILDTNVVSALRVPDRNPKATDWLRVQPDEEIWLTVFTIGEIQQGIERAPDSFSKSVLAQWLAEIRLSYHDRIIPFGEREAAVWGSIVAPLESSGRNPALVDSMIAAIAVSRGMVIVTRNVRDFERFNVPIINPWDDENGA